MWQPTTTVLNDSGQDLTDPLGAWIYLFAKAWEALEPDPEDLDLQGFLYFGLAVAEKHGDEDPAVVAKRLYPEAGEYHADLYPADDDESDGAEQPSEPAPPPAFGLADSDVPF